MKQVAGTRKRATLLKWVAVQKWILKSHSWKLHFVKFTHIYKYQVAVQLVYLDFLRLDCTALVMSVGGKEGYGQLRQVFFFFRFLFLEWEDGRKKHQLVASCTPPNGDLAYNPGMCPDWESDWRPFSFQAGTQSIEPHQPRLRQFFIVSFRQSARTWADLNGALLALNLSKGLRRSVHYKEGLRLLWEEDTALCTRAWQLGKCDIGGGKLSTCTCLKKWQNGESLFS